MLDLPIPEEEAALLGDIKPEIKHEIKPPQVPEQLENCEQVQPAKLIATPTASLPSHPSQLSNLPSFKVKKPWNKPTGVDAISATQWVQAYLQEN